MPSRSRAARAGFLRAAIAAMSLVLAAPAAARAGGDDPAASSTERAREHFERGEKLFSLGRFEEARKEYEAAFDAQPLPGLLFNIGQCHRNLRDYRAAVFSFRKYLSLVPDAPNRDAVRELIAELEAKIAAEDEARRRERDRALTTATPVQPHPAPPRPMYTRWWFWTGVAVTAAAAGAIGYALSSDGAAVPASNLGNIEFPK